MRNAEYKQLLLKVAAEIDDQICRTDICNPRYSELLKKHWRVCTEFIRVVIGA